MQNRVWYWEAETRDGADRVWRQSGRAWFGINPNPTRPIAGKEPQMHENEKETDRESSTKERRIEIPQHEFLLNFL